MSNTKPNKSVAFCPHCLEGYPYDENTFECVNCGGQIPGGIIELAIEATEKQEKINTLKSILSLHGYTDKQLSYILEATPALFIFPQDKAKPTDGTPDVVRYFAAGFMKDGKFSGLVHGYEGGNEYSDHWMLDGKFLPYECDGEFINDDSAEDLLNTCIDSTFVRRCYAQIEYYATYNHETYNYELKHRTNLNGGPKFPMPNYGETLFGNIAGTWTLEALLERLDIHDVAKKILDKHASRISATTALFDETMSELCNKSSYGHFIDKKNYRSIKAHIQMILEEVDDRGENPANIAFEDCDICYSCEKVLLPDDELYCHKVSGKPMCTDCAGPCDMCGEYFHNNDLVLFDDNCWLCRTCASKETK